MLSDDGKTVLLDSPEVIAAMEAYTALWTGDDIAQPLDFDAGGECFMVGKCATLLFIPGYMSAMRALDPQPFDWDVQVIPSQPKGTVHGHGHVRLRRLGRLQEPPGRLGLREVPRLTGRPEGHRGQLRRRAAAEVAGQRSGLHAAGPAAGQHHRRSSTNGANGILPTSFPGNCGSLYAGQISQEIKDALAASIVKTSSVTDAFTTANDNIQACLDKG